MQLQYPPLTKYIYISRPIPPVPICFPAGTPVQTDQGFIDIDKINHTIHTINNNKIVAITKTVTPEKHLVCLEKNALLKNVPCETTTISQNHLIMNKKGNLVKAKDLIGTTDKIYYTDYNGEILYNVLLETRSIMTVNNLIVETLDPKHIIAKIYNSNYSEEKQHQLLRDLDTKLRKKYNHSKK